MNFSPREQPQRQAAPPSLARSPRSKSGIKRVPYVLRRLGGTLKTSLAVVGLATLGYGYYEYQQTFPATAASDEDEKKKRKKKVLVLPFDRMELVEKKRGGFWSQSAVVRSLQEKLGGEEENGVVRVEVRELVDLLHHAAADKEIVAVYGKFGGLMGNLAKAGWADLEDVRNALESFKESNIDNISLSANQNNEKADNVHDSDVSAPIEAVVPKPLYCYSDTFESLGDPGNKDYYLASVFTHIHMQQHGALNLAGLSSQHFFLRDALQKYGVIAHVFKHGQYKNAPNMFTDKGFTRPHRENAISILRSLDLNIRQNIWNSRKNKAYLLLPPWLQRLHQKNTETVSNERREIPSYHWDQLWKRVRQSGTFDAGTALKAGLVDFLPPRDPLFGLLEQNASDNKKVNENDDKKVKDENYSKEKAIDEKSDKDIRSRLDACETDFEAFTAKEAVTLKDYAKQVSKKKRAEERTWQLKRYALRSPRAAALLSAAGLIEVKADDKKLLDKKNEKIALLTVQGTIQESNARNLVSQIRKIRKDKDTKCVVLRVVSPGGIIQPCETIMQELKALDVPLICSLGNVAASGGYYISANADRIFCSEKSLTGSIGVFGVRLDLRSLAAQYGIHIETLNADGSGTNDRHNLAAQNDSFAPMTRKMKQNFSANIDRYYDRFKQVVSEGRGLSMDSVEMLAQGRVWTGVQAKSNGLVDELGGLDRAVAYAIDNYTSGEAQVIDWPQRKSLLGLLKNENSSGKEFGQNSFDLLLPLTMIGVHGNDTTVAGLLNRILVTLSSSGISSFSSVILAADENTALRCVFDNYPATKKNQGLPSWLPPDFWD